MPLTPKLRIDWPDRPHPPVELVEERDAGRQVELGDLRVGDLVEVLHEGTQRVSVRRDEYELPGEEIGDDRVVPVGEHADDHVLRGTRSSEAHQAECRRNAGRALPPGRTWGRVAAAGRRRSGARACTARRRTRAESAPCSFPGGRRSGARSVARTGAPGSTGVRPPRARARWCGSRAPAARCGPRPEGVPLVARSSPARTASCVPRSESPTSTQPVKRPCSFQTLSPWRSSRSR